MIEGAIKWLRLLTRGVFTFGLKSLRLVFQVLPQKLTHILFLAVKNCRIQICVLLPVKFGLTHKNGFYYRLRFGAMTFLTGIKHIMVSFGKLAGGCIGAFMTRLIQVITLPLSWIGSKRRQKDFSKDTGAPTKYQMWRVQGGRISTSPLTSLAALYVGYKLPHRPYLNSKRGGGNAYWVNALQMYSMIALLVWQGSKLIASPEIVQAQDIPGGIISNSGIVTPGAWVGGIGVQVTPGAPTQTPYPTYTPYPTPTSILYMSPVPAPTKQNFDPGGVNWVFSYYYPDLVGVDFEKYSVNCHTDNLIYNDMNTKVIGCKNTSASGLPWKDFVMYHSVYPEYIGGVAVPYFPGSYDPIYPMGSIIKIESPTIMAGDYLVMDICPGCDDFFTDKGVLFLDFLAKGLPENVTFWDPVRVVSVRYPGE